MKPIIIHSDAKAELDEAVAYYENCRAGLGQDLLSEVEQAIGRIQRNPKQHSVYKDTDFRKCVINRFPFLIFYMELEDSVWIAAVAHSKRRPDYWRNRTVEE